MTDTLPGAAVPNPLDEAAITAAVEQAVAAIAAASTLDELKAARLAHTGEKSALSLANREIGGLPKDQKAAAGKLMGASRGRVNKALADRTVELEAENDARILVEETVDVTAAPRRRRAGARHPLSTLQDRVADIFVGMGWEIAEGPEVESEWFNFDALNFKPDHPAREMQDTFFVEPPEAHLLHAHPHLPGAGPLHAGTRTARLRAVPRQGLPHRRARRHPHPGVPPVRGPGHRQEAHHGRPPRHPGALRAPDVRRRGPDPAAPQLLPVHRTLRRAGHLAPGRQGRPQLDRMGRLRHGQPQRAPRRGHRSGRSIQVLPSAWASSGPSCSATRSATCAT